MAQKQCSRCSEMVDEAKAFCPGCGNAFVAEESREASSFEKMDSTVQLGQTMYNQMLSDMGLNIGKQAPAPEKRVEVVQPIATSTPTKKAPASVRKSSMTKWVLLGLGVLAIVLIFLLAAAMLLYYYWPRIT